MRAKFRWHELQLWSLINAQQDLQASIKVLSSSEGRYNSQLDAIEQILNAYEAYTWQIVPIQVKLRREICQLSNVNAPPPPRIIRVESAAMVSENRDEGSSKAGTDINRPPKTPLQTNQSQSSNLSCRKCDKKFVDSKSLAAHFRAEHLMQIPRKCNECKAKIGEKCTHLLPSKCNVCHKHFATPDQLRQHRQSHAECRVCGKWLNDGQSLQHHMDFVHGEQQKTEEIACDECGFVAANQKAHAQHILYMHERPFPCPICSIRYTTTNYLKAHIAKTHPHAKAMDDLEKGAYTRPYACSICNERYKNRVYLKKHMASKHKGGSGKRSESAKNIQYDCRYCHQKFTTTRALHEHKTKIHNTELIVNLICRLCGDKIKSHSKMLSHFEVNHSYDAPYVCNLCDNLPFSTDRSLKRHRVTTHSGQRAAPFFCTDCSKAFKCEITFKQHLQFIHNIDQRLNAVMCDICGYVVATKVMMEQHMLKHYPKRPESVPTVSTDAAPKRHITNHVKDEKNDDRPFECEKCGQCFSTNGGRRQHLRQKHATELPHKCNVCNKLFLEQTDLQAHTMVHTGIAAFECDQCQQRFKNYRLLYIHKKEMHKMNVKK